MKYLTFIFALLLFTGCNLTSSDESFNTVKVTATEAGQLTTDELTITYTADRGELSDTFTGRFNSHIASNGSISVDADKDYKFVLSFMDGNKEVNRVMKVGSFTYNY